MATVFEKLDDAYHNDRGVTLTFSEVWMLMELTGDEIPKARDRFEQWQDFLEEFETMKARDAEGNYEHDEADSES
ncbi:MAG: hypothetical protein OXH06_03660 [Gemmatimonadetes bacterium]|nr:hypothetical protein [Gemmatimonadota bacterium]